MVAKHTVATDALDTLGTIIGEGEKRDAIHLAVEPVVAGQSLRPGEHVNLGRRAGGDAVAWLAAPGHGVGIVDPFLLKPISQGERFWLIVYPRQITSLRHVWSHPSFPEEEIKAAPVDAVGPDWDYGYGYDDDDLSCSC